MLGRCCRAGREMIGAHHAILGMLEEDRKTFGHVLTEGLDDAACSPAGLPQTWGGIAGPSGRGGKASSGCGRHGAEGRPLVIIPGHPPAGSFLGVPVATAGKLYGVLAFVDKAGAAGSTRRMKGWPRAWRRNWPSPSRMRAGRPRSSGMPRGWSDTRSGWRSCGGSIRRSCQPIGRGRWPRPPCTISAN